MWYVIQVKTGEEEWIREKCRRVLPVSACRNIFAPKFQKMMKVKGIWRVEEEILFPGYLFLEMPKREEPFDELEKADMLKERLQPLGSMIKPVCIGGGFYPIRQEEEALLRSLMHATEHNEYILERSRGYVVDGKLVVTNGPLIPYTDYVKWFDRHKRIGKLEISLWGETRKITVGLEVVARVTAKEFQELDGKAG